MSIKIVTNNLFSDKVFPMANNDDSKQFSIRLSEGVKPAIDAIGKRKGWSRSKTIDTVFIRLLSDPDLLERVLKD